jgi:acyl-CoA synthetase (AMP-forming)/AMP-acid ligase II
LFTGDDGFMDADGWFYTVDRKISGRPRMVAILATAV